MILAKILITIVVVTTLSIVAERAGPRLAGILAGYPAGSAISLFFIGLEISPQFAGQSALYNVAGLAALLCFLLVYWIISARLAEMGFWLSAAAGTLAALAVFLAAAWGLHSLRLSPVFGVLPTFVAIPAFYFLFRRIDNAAITTRVRLGLGVLLIRSGLAAGVIILVTGAARLVGPEWAGLFSAFPITVFPLVLILHRTYGPEQAYTVIKNLPLGLWSLVIYSMTVSYVYPRIGIAAGTLAAFGAATLYLLALAAAKQVRRAGART